MTSNLNLETYNPKSEKVDASARMILLASDGVWDMLDNAEAVPYSLFLYCSRA